MCQSEGVSAEQVADKCTAFVVRDPRIREERAELRPSRGILIVIE